MAENFIKVASITEVIPGTMKRVEIAQKRVLVANVEGTIFCTDDMCTHEDASLSLGALQGEFIKCPLHGSRFNLRTGEAMDEPADQPLQTYPVKLQGEDILAAL